MKVLAALSLILTASMPFAQAADETPVLTYLRPLQEIDLASAESGIVGSVLVSPGDHVTKGQEILRLNSTVIEAQLAQAEAQAKQEGRIKSAEAEHLMAKQRLDIINSLKGSGSTNQAEGDKAVASLAVADGQLKAAQEERDSLRHSTATIKAQLDQRIIRSPIDGVVTEITRDVGEPVDARRSDIPDYLARIVDLSQLIARVHIPSGLTEKLKLGQKLRLVLDGPNKTEGEGTIRFISPTVDAATGLAEVHLVFPNADGKLRSGIAGTLMVPVTVAE